MNPWCSGVLRKSVVLVCLTFSGSLALAAEPRPAEFKLVEGGQAKAVFAWGKPWRGGQGWLEGSGTGNLLCAGRLLGEGDFRVTARISLDKLNGTAASLVLGGNHFGFDGRNGTLFVEGPQFGHSRSVGASKDVLAPGQPIDVEAIRAGERLTLRLAGKQIVQLSFPRGPVGLVALRPWRSTMRVYEFAVSGSLVGDVGAVHAAIYQTADRSRLAVEVEAGGSRFDPASPPAGLAFRPALGLVTAAAVDGELLYESKTHLFETRATRTPGGDWLLMFPEGEHYGGKTKKVNDLMAMARRPESGASWSDPKPAFACDYNQHGFVPLVPRGSKRIYAFGTQPVWNEFSAERGQGENAPIGFRWSDDDGRTWSAVQLIRPVNDPEFKGMSVMRMCETDRGTWLIGAHAADWSVKPLRTWQYVLRSEDQGKTWHVLPGKRPGGWFVPKFNRMDEGRPVSLGGGRVLMMFRTPEGHLWAARSEDDGKTWTAPAPTPLIHPDAPPMLFPLSDGKTLAAFHHNRCTDRNYSGLSAKSEIMKDRSELWVSLSRDGGLTWSEPRFVLANALPETEANAWFNYQCSYLDAVSDRGVLHMFLPHRWKRALHLTVKESDLEKLPHRAEIRAAAFAAGGSTDAAALPSRTKVFVSGQDGYHTYRIPSLLVTAKGTLLAFAEGRKNGGGDAGDIDMMLRRSTDNGQTWQPAQVVWNDQENTCGNPCPVVDPETGTIWLLLTWNRGDDPEHKIIAQTSHDSRRVFVTSSTDDGRTWAKPREITEQAKKPDWTWYATGPGAGIAIQHGPHRGRMVVPCDHIEAKTKHYYSHVIYSDDHGKTWTLGGSTPMHQVNECEVVELTGGRLMLNMRNYDHSKQARQTAISADGGMTWTDQRHAGELIEPICQASIRRYAWPEKGGKSVLLFSNPASTRRERMTVRASFDEGRTWPVARLLDPRPSAYSCLATLPDGTIGCLYEAGDRGAYQTVSFARFDLDWVTGGKRD